MKYSKNKYRDDYGKLKIKKGELEMRLKPAETDYDLHKMLVRTYVRLERDTTRDLSVEFYNKAARYLRIYKVPLGERESKTMRQVRARFRRGRGDIGEPDRFTRYFYQKFREDLKKARKEIYGHPYSRRQWY